MHTHTHTTYTCTSPLESRLLNIYQTATGFIPHAPSMSLTSHLPTPLTVGPADGTPTPCSIADCCVGKEGHSKTHWLSKALSPRSDLHCAPHIPMTKAGHMAMHTYFK